MRRLIWAITVVKITLDFPLRWKVSDAACDTPKVSLTRLNGKESLVTFIWACAWQNQYNDLWLGSSMVRVLARYARGPGFESRSGHVLLSSLWHLVASCGSMLGLRAAEGLFRRFWHGSEQRTNLIKQGEIVTYRPCGSIAQLSECPHGMREVLGSSLGRAMCFFLLCHKPEWKNSIRCQTYAKTEDHIDLKLYFSSQHPRHLFSAQRKMQHLHISWRNPCVWGIDFCWIIKSCSCFWMDHKSKKVWSIDLWRQKVATRWICPLPLKRGNL